MGSGDQSSNIGEHLPEERKQLETLSQESNEKLEGRKSLRGKGNND